MFFYYRSEDVEKDIQLPLIKHETILLDLEQYGVMTYNALQAGIVINTIDSERTGQVCAVNNMIKCLD